MKRHNKILALALLAVSIMGVALPAIAATTGINMSRSGGLACRPNSDGSGTPYGYLGNGAMVSILSTTGSWWQVQYNSSTTGYSSSDYLVISGNTVKCTGTGVRMRSTPGGAILSYQPQLNEQFSITDVSTNWIKVKANNGTEGWISWDLLQKTGNDSASTWPPPAYAEYCANRNYATNTILHVVNNELCSMTTKTHRSLFYGTNWDDTHAGEVIHTHPAHSHLNVSDCNLQYKDPYR